MWQRSEICLVMLLIIYCPYICHSRADADASDVFKKLNSFKLAESLMRSLLKKGILILGRDKPSAHFPLIRTRVKRQKPEGNDQQKEFSDVAKIDAARAFQIYLTALQKLWKASALGGREPLTPNVPKPVIKDFKEKVMNYFIPAHVPLPGYPRGVMYS